MVGGDRQARHEGDGEHEVEVTEGERRNGLLGVGLDELGAQLGRLLAQRFHRRDRERMQLGGGALVLAAAATIGRMTT